MELGGKVRAALRRDVDAPGNTESRMPGFGTAIEGRDAELALALAEHLPEAENARFRFECRWGAISYGPRRVLAGSAERGPLERQAKA